MKIAYSSFHFNNTIVIILYRLGALKGFHKASGFINNLVKAPIAFHLKPKPVPNLNKVSIFFHPGELFLTRINFLGDVPYPINCHKMRSWETFFAHK